MSYTSTYRCPVVLMTLLAGSCALGDAAFNVHRTPALEQSGNTVSVFGVYKGGRMSPKYWEQIGPDISSVLGAPGQKLCEAAFDERLQSAAPQLYASIDSDTKENGVGNDVLGQLAPHAQGGLILALDVFGQPPAERAPKPGSPPGAQQGTQRGPGYGGPRSGGGGMGRRGGAMRGMSMGGMAGPQPHREIRPEDSFQVGATLYSVKTHAVVATVEMRYTGDSSDDAIKKFADKLRAVAPALSCAGWRWPETPANSKPE